jgi:hypothetical protein
MRTDIGVFAPGAKVIALSVEADERGSLIAAMVNVVSSLGVHGYARHLPKPPA